MSSLLFYLFFIANYTLFRNEMQNFEIEQLKLVRFKSPVARNCNSPEQIPRLVVLHVVHYSFDLVCNSRFAPLIL